MSPATETRAPLETPIEKQGESRGRAPSPRNVSRPGALSGSNPATPPPHCKFAPGGLPGIASRQALEAFSPPESSALPGRSWEGASERPGGPVSRPPLGAVVLRRYEEAERKTPHGKTQVKPVARSDVHLPTECPPAAVARRRAGDGPQPMPRGEALPQSLQGRGLARVMEPELYSLRTEIAAGTAAGTWG